LEQHESAFTVWKEAARASARSARTLVSVALLLAPLGCGASASRTDACAPPACVVVSAPLAPVASSTPRVRDPEDIVIALDLSGSMRALLEGDVGDLSSPSKDSKAMRHTRIETARAVVKEFIARRTNDRVGVVVFAKEAFVLSPLTFDHATVAAAVSKIEIDSIDPSGTAIGDAVLTATSQLRKANEESKIILLITDGDNNAGTASPESAAEVAKKMNCTIDAVQIGNGDEADIEDGLDLYGNPHFVRERFPVNPELLKKMTDATGGRMVVVTSSTDLEAAVLSIVP